jgi:hypothetical protein
MVPRRMCGVVTTIMLWVLSGPVALAEPVTIGSVEEVILLPWKVRLPARIDTGAVQSSLAAKDLKVRNHVAEFRFPEKHGGLTVRLPVVAWVQIRTNQGRERRPVVEMELCLSSKTIRTRVNLDDRAGLQYPFLVGRNTLAGNFLVDVAQPGTHPPRCLEKSPP